MPEEMIRTRSVDDETNVIIFGVKKKKVERHVNAHSNRMSTATSSNARSDSTLCQDGAKLQNYKLRSEGWGMTGAVTRKLKLLTSE